jgi:hypothetical protein
VVLGTSRAFTAASPEGPNPWAGSARALEDIERDHEQLRLRIVGEELKAVLDKRKELQQRLDDLSFQRTAADRELAKRLQHEVVKKYMGAGSICRARGWGFSWELFRQWYGNQERTL